MAVFVYKASGGGEVSGTVTADTPRQARDLLRERGLVVTDLADYRPSAGRHGGRRGGGGRFGRQVTELARELSTLLGVGVPLLEALETLGRQHRGRFQPVVLLLRDRVAAGGSLAGAMGEQPRVFDELCVNISEVGEDAGTLDSSLERLAEFREWSQQIRGRIAAALTYPAIVLCLAVVCTVFLMTFVVPRILEPLIEQNLPLPWPTRVVKGVSDFALAWGWVVVLVVLVAAGGVGAFVRTARGRRVWHRLLLRLPVLGDLVTKQAIVHIAVVMSTLLKSGVVFVRAVQVAQRTTKNVVLREALERCERAVVAGGDIGEAIEGTGAFPPMVVQVFALGQQSGRLDEMLDRLAAAYNQQVSAAAQRLTAVLEPAIIVALAVLVLFIVMATVLPILEAGNAIG